MASKYEKLITDYCTVHGILIPSGFGRNVPGRYAIVRSHVAPPKLVAATWFKTADVLYFVKHFLVPELGDALGESIHILDFKAGVMLAYPGGERLVRVGPLSFAGPPNRA